MNIRRSGALAWLTTGLFALSAQGAQVPEDGPPDPAPSRPTADEVNQSINLCGQTIKAHLAPLIEQNYNLEELAGVASPQTLENLREDVGVYFGTCIDYMLKNHFGVAQEDLYDMTIKSGVAQPERGVLKLYNSLSVNGYEQSFSTTFSIRPKPEPGPESRSKPKPSTFALPQGGVPI